MGTKNACFLSFEGRYRMEQSQIFENENINLRRLKYSPLENPFMSRGSEIRTRHKTIKTRAARQELVDSETGELVAMSMIHVIEEKDEEHFVKVFADGVRAAFDLSRTGSRVFQTVLGEYQREKMTGGYSDSLTLYWFGDGLSGEKIDMSEKSFQRGLKELIYKEFLKPKLPNQYWVNPALFFKGDRVAFMREYRLTSSKKTLKQEKILQIEERTLFD